MAVLLPSRGHLRYVEDAVANLHEQGILIHCYTDAEQVSAFRKDAYWDAIRPWATCSSIPYRVVYTPVTHIHPERYRHPRARVVHLPHSMVSLHTIFPPRTFSGFDEVFCCGPHHVEEMKAISKVNGTRTGIRAVGYEMIDRFGRLDAHDVPHRDRPVLLVAPTWGDSSLLVRHGRELIDRLLRSFDVILRPHPWKIEQISPVLEALEADHGGTGRFRIDMDVDARPAMREAEVMLSDYSGVAFEFALGFLRPVVFMDGPRKNAYLDQRSILDREGIEVWGRERIGSIASTVDAAEEGALKAIQERGVWRTRLEDARKDLLFNYGHCAATAASRILELLNEPVAR